MADESAALDLGGLPDVIAGLSQATVQAALQVVQGSLPRPDDGELAADRYYAIAATQLAFRFLFVRKATQVVLFFHKGQTEVRPLSGTVELRLRASPAQPEGAVPASGAADRGAEGSGGEHLRLRLPSFIDLVPSLEERVRYAPVGAAPDSLVLFRIGPGAGHRLAIALAEHLEASAVTYFDGVRHELGASWPARPFLDLALAIAGWLRDQRPGGGASASDPLIDLDLGGMGTSNDAGGVIRSLVTAYRQTEAALPRTPAPRGELAAAIIARPVAKAAPSREWLTQAGLLPGYEIESYSAEVQLRLGQDGQIRSEGEAVSLAMSLAVSRRSAGLTVDIALLPPDFLITGLLHSQFVESLANLSPGREFPPDLAAPEVFRDAIRSAQGELSIFRVARSGEVDEDLILVPLRGGRAERQLLLSVDAVIDRSTPVPRVKLSSLRLRYDSQTDADQQIDRATADYFLRLAQSLHIWTRWTRMSDKPK